MLCHMHGILTMTFQFADNIQGIFDKSFCKVLVSNMLSVLSVN